MTLTDDKDEETDVPTTDEADKKTENVIEETSEETEKIDPKDAEIAELKEKLDAAMRNAAASQNMARRATDDLQAARELAVRKFAGDLLDLSDNFKRAVKSLPEDSGDEQIANIVHGIKNLQNNLANTFNRHGIKIIDVIKEETAFAPDLHEAILEVENNDLPKGTIVNIGRDGYTLNGRLLRATQVIVSKPST